jgi:hypothetical protein
MDQEARRNAMKPLEPFVGEWDVTADFSEEPVPARSAFEWTLGGQFLVQRTEIEHPAAPDSTILYGYDEQSDGYTQHYFDSRGVARLYAMTFRDGTWTLRRDTPDFSDLGFWQRWEAAFEDEGRTIRGRWETSTDEGATWTLDFNLVYRRIG